jgi:hypothetical protein
VQADGDSLLEEFDPQCFSQALTKHQVRPWEKEKPDNEGAIGVNPVKMEPCDEKTESYKA